ncbi:recombinase family protein [Salinicola sp. CPA57]|uniref:recombinase family protein n=1 Tax=Salinicola sp. CPA57 TaxID=1949080 RepID=UPI000DA17E2D|nr:recombinase family protein [Salinicola sp. CPA57]
MFVRAYLRASTPEQDAQRARQQLVAFAAEHAQPIASWYGENASGAIADRAELRRLLEDAHHGDIILVESIDRLSRLGREDWRRQRAELDAKGLRIVALDLPTSHQAMAPSAADEFTARMLDAINDMMLDMLAAIARKDYEDRRHRQRQGIEKAKAEGKYQGRQKDMPKRRRIAALLQSTHADGRSYSIRDVASFIGCSTSTVKDVKRDGP